MSVTKQLSSKANIKQVTNSDLPVSPRHPVLAKYGPVESSLNQTVINFPFQIDTINNPEALIVTVDGKTLSEGSNYDFTFSAVDSFGMSSQITLAVPLPAGLNIQAIKLGLKKETEMLQDQRFTNLYDSLDESFQGFISSSAKMVPTNIAGTPGSGLFYSTITNRSAMPDLRQDLGVRYGLERIMITNFYQLPSEVGPAGEPVWGVNNDTLNRIRLVGGLWTIERGATGVFANTGTNSTEYVEVTFFGTGLNMLAPVDNIARDMRASVNGGTEGPNIFPAVAAGTLSSRNYNPNQILPVVANLPLGVHTVRIRNAAASNSGVVAGFEILNESAVVNPGVAFNKGLKIQKNSQSTLTINSGFESGTLGTRGGRVLTYLKADGTIGRAVTPTNTTQQNLTAADHTNEEVARVYDVREFGASRGDDFSLAVGTGDWYYTLDDGTTTLHGDNVSHDTSVVSLGVFPVAANDYLIFTFVGTGLDIKVRGYNAYSSTNTINIDGTNVGSLTIPGGTNYNAVLRIVSGLPYGTHTVRITRNSGGFFFITEKFIVYQPKTPELPSGAVALSSYNIMADFAANTTAGIANIATGVLRKQLTRGPVLVNGTGGSYDWTVGFNGAVLGGVSLSTNRNNSYFEYTFFGTGFDFRFSAFSSRTNSVLVSLKNLSSGGSLQTLNTTNFPTIASSAYGGTVSFNSATGVLSQVNSTVIEGAGVRISNLPLAFYTVRFTNQTTSDFLASALDIITPVHSHADQASSASQGVLPLENISMADLRKFSALKDASAQVRNVTQAIGIGTTPNIVGSVPIPVSQMNITHKSKTGRIKISYAIQSSGNTPGNNISYQAYLNNVPLGEPKAATLPALNYSVLISDAYIMDVPIDMAVQVYLACTPSQTVTLRSRTLIVEDV
jgi:hypothetical protein